MAYLWQTIDTPSIHITIQTTARAVPPGTWSPGGQPGALYASADWFTLAETLGTRLRYLVACQSESGAALAARLLAPALAPEGTPGETYLVAGSWNSNLAPLPMVHNCQVEVRRAVLSALLSAFARIAQEKHVPGLCLPFLLPEAAGELAELIGESGYVLRTAPTTWIELYEPSFAALLATFARKQRKNMRRELRLFEAACGEVHLETVGDILDELATPVVQNRVRHAGAAEREMVREMLCARLKVFGERVLTLSTRRQGQLVAAITLWPPMAVSTRVRLAARMLAGRCARWSILCLATMRSFAMLLSTACRDTMQVQRPTKPGSGAGWSWSRCRRCFCRTILRTPDNRRLCSAGTTRSMHSGRAGSAQLRAIRYHHPGALSIFHRWRNEVGETGT
ncbi:MAG TPA: hypothetical protein VGF67_21420 [Ktedonobacteraceae bacterium]|jgi:hypothetical protein